MRYLRKVKTKSGKTVYRFKPPEAAVKAGVVPNRTYPDGRTARYEVPRLLEKLDEWRQGKGPVFGINTKSRLVDIFNHFSNTEHFKRLSSSSQNSYSYGIPNLLSTKVQGRTLGDFRIDSLSAVLCSSVYDQWVRDKGVPTANRWSTLFGVLINYASSLDLIQSNPMAKVKKLGHTPRSEVWTEKQVEAFVETAFTKFRWRSMGLLALLCYEWAQRPKDIANLKWEAVDLLGGSVTITQTKRGATVYLPIPEHLSPVLSQQNEDLGFQPWVVPDVNRPTGGYEPMTPSMMSILTKEIKEASGTPIHLRVGDLRKSAITEMVSAGVDTSAIMSVSGHKSIQSLNPYLKHTLGAATSALDMRRNK